MYALFSGLQISDFDNLSQRGSARDYLQLQAVMGSASRILRRSFIDPLENNLEKRTLFSEAYNTGNKIVSIYWVMLDYTFSLKMLL